VSHQSKEHTISGTQCFFFKKIAFENETIHSSLPPSQAAPSAVFQLLNAHHFFILLSF
jgi:fatty acid-binding protein DegV